MNSKLNQTDAGYYNKKKKPVNKEENQKHFSSLYEEAFERKERMENLKKKVINEEELGKETNTANVGSNKMMLKNVMWRYREVVNSVFEHDNAENEDRQNVEYNKVNLIQLNGILNKLGFVHVNVNEVQSEDRNENNTEANNAQVNESTLKQTEKKKVYEVWEVLKDQEGYVNVDKLFLFVLAVINLYEYYLYSSYKKTYKPENEDENMQTLKETNKKAKSNLKDKYKDETKKREILQKIAEEIEKKVTTPTKYGGYDAEDNFILTYEKAKLVNRDFNIFYVNFMNSKILSAGKQTKDKAQTKAEPAFRPSINPHSNRLYTEYRKKVLNTVNFLSNFIGFK